MLDTKIKVGDLVRPSAALLRTCRTMKAVKNRSIGKVLKRGRKPYQDQFLVEWRNLKIPERLHPLMLERAETE
jgi:hypothetical protein